MTEAQFLLIDDIHMLISLKEQIKNQVTGNVSWQERMELYRNVQLINERIEELMVPF